MTDLFVSACCEGEYCFCGAPATNKVAEVVFFDDPLKSCHELTSYVCRAHFRQIMGAACTRPPITEETVARVIRERVKVDATGLSPAVAAAFIVGIDEAARAVMALFEGGNDV